jgi:diadenylate cyclase
VGLIDCVARAAADLSRRRRGALVVLERQAELGEIVETGVKLDAAPSTELLLALFQPGGALHDGAVVLQRGRLAAAGCLLPLSASPQLRELGTRHRAAVGLAEEVDAAVVVVSEERGEISVAVDGFLHRALDEAALRQLLARLLVRAKPRGVAALFRGRASGSVGASKPEEDRRAAI